MQPKPTLDRAPLIILVSIGLAIGLLITGLAWVFPDSAKSLFSDATWFWTLTLVGTFLILTGAKLAQDQRYPTLPKPVLLLAVVAATALVYLFPELFAPGCNRMPRAFAACPADCRITTCSDWAAPGERGCNAKPPDKGCCFAYETTCDPDCSDPEPEPTPIPTNQPPTISGVVSCALPGVSGWCRNGAVLNLFASDPQGFATTITGDLSGAAFSCAGPACAQNLPVGSGTSHFQASAPASGLSSAVGSGSFAYDPTPPSATLVISGAAASNGWYKSASVSTTGADANSGISVTQVSVDGGAWQAAATLAEGTHSVLGRALDNAGNLTVTPAQVVKVDATAPIISASVTSGTLVGSWYRSEVVIEASATDVTSGLDLIETRLDGGAWATGGQVTVTADGVHTLEVSAADRAGNLASSRLVVRKDLTPPSLSIPTAPDGSNGWYVTLPTLSLLASDATSGLASALFGNGQATTAITGNGVYPLSATALDHAGNSTSAATTVRVDTTPPLLSVSVPTPDGSNGWFLSAPTFSLTASDATSGLSSALFGNGLPTMKISSEGVFTVNATAKDNAGNSTPYVSSVKKDSTPPSLSIPTTPDGSNGWYVTLPTLSLLASDVTSGLASALFSNGQSSYAVTAQGVTNVSSQAVDYAGNTTSATTIVSVDTVPPALSVSAPAVDGLNGWYVSSPTFALTASDATSGLASALFSGGQASRTISTDGIFNLSALASDKAGNIAPGTLTVKRDATPPSLSIPTAPDGLNGWYVSLPTISLAASDATSGLASAFFADGKSTADISADGVYPLSAAAADNAGNTVSASQTIQVDTTPPALYIPSMPDGLNGWYVTFPTLSLLSSDATSGLASALFGNGQKSQLINADGSYSLTASATDKAGNTASAIRAVQVDTTAPALSLAIPYAPDGQNGWYITKPTLALAASDATSGLASAAFDSGGSSFTTADGTQIVSATAKDLAGNASTLSQIFKVDTTPPTLTPAITATGSNGWYNAAVTVAITTFDTVSGVGPTEYRLDGGIWQTGAELIVSAEGQHTVEMRVTDQAGNLTTASRSFKVDTTQPVSAFSNPPEGTTQKVSGTVLLSGASSDAISGLAATEISLDGGETWQALPFSNGAWSYSWETLRVPDGLYTILVHADDKAGNRENTARVRIIVGNRPPKVEIQPSWWLWEAGSIQVQERQIPLRDVSVRISCAPYHPDVVLTYTGGNVPANLKWDRLCGNGAYAAESGNYPVTLTACDTFGHCADDSGVIKVPFIAPPVPTWTPTAEPSPTATSEAKRPVQKQQPTPTRVVPPPVVTPVHVPSAPAHQPAWLAWLLGILLAGLLALASAAIVDPRPRALRELGKTLARMAGDEQI